MTILSDASEIDSPEIGAILPFFGGKRTLASTIVTEFGHHSAYWEPMVGSMAVLLEKPQCRMETVSDLHGDLTNLAHIIQHPKAGAAFYRRLRRALVSEALFRESAAVIDSPYEPDELGVSLDLERNLDRDLERAHHYFVVSWLGRNGVAGTTVGCPGGSAHSFCVRYTNNGGTPAKRWTSAVESIPQWRRRMRGVTILRRDAFEVLEKIDDVEGTVIYVDSPYLKETRTGLKGKGAMGPSTSSASNSAKYLHDFNPEDHIRLAKALGRFKRTRVIVSYYDSPVLTNLYPGWTIRQLAGNKGIANASKRDGKGATAATEVLLINGPSLVEKPVAKSVAKTSTGGRLFD